MDASHRKFYQRADGAAAVPGCRPGLCGNMKTSKTMTARIAAFLILWIVFAAVLAPLIGQFIRTGAREMPPPDGEDSITQQPPAPESEASGTPPAAAPSGAGPRQETQPRSTP